MQHCPDQYFSMKEVEQFIPGQVWETDRGTQWRVTDEETAPINFNGFKRRAVTLRQGVNPDVKGKKMVKAFDAIGLSWGIIKPSTMPFDHPYLKWNQTKIIINGIEYIQWAGGESPVSASSSVEVVYRSGDSERLLGCEVNWSHTEHDSHVDVVAYRIVMGLTNMAKIIGKEFKAFWASDWDQDKEAFVSWYEITLKDGTVLNDESELDVYDIEDGAIITKVIGEAIVNGKETKISTLYKRWKDAQTNKNYLVKVDSSDAEALMKLIVESGLKVSVEVF